MTSSVGFGKLFTTFLVALASGVLASSSPNPKCPSQNNYIKLGSVKEDPKHACACLEQPVALDLLIMVDATESVGRAGYERTLDQVRQLYCDFDHSFNDIRMGLLTFNKEPTLQIPIQKYSRQQWLNQIAAIPNNTCCQCCTDMAWAFDEGRNILDNTPPPTSPYPRKVWGWMYSDGLPYQNENYGPYAASKIPSPVYTYETVPAKAQRFRDFLPNPDNAKIIFRATGSPLERNYFLGRTFI